MTYQTALEIAKHLGVIGETGFAELVAKHSDKLSLECPNEFIDTIENSPDEADAREQMQFFCVVREICTVSEIDK